MLNSLSTKVITDRNKSIMYTHVTLFFYSNIVFDLVVECYDNCRQSVDVRYSYFDMIHGLGRVPSPPRTVLQVQLSIKITTHGSLGIHKPEGCRYREQR